MKYFKKNYYTVKWQDLTANKIFYIFANPNNLNEWSVSYVPCLFKDYYMAKKVYDKVRAASAGSAKPNTVVSLDIVTRKFKLVLVK